MAAQPVKRGASALLRQAWDEIPDVVGGTIMALIGIGCAGVGLANYYSKDLDNRRYKLGYVVMRPDDPRVNKIHKD